MRKSLFIGLLLCWSGTSLAHIGEPSVRTIRFVGDGSPRAWVVMENVGLLLEEAGGFRWLCDEAITPLPGLQDLAQLEERRWSAATRNGVFVTEDNGCHFASLAGALTEHVIGGIDPHPSNSGEAVLSTQTLGLPNDVFRTTDGGRTWQPAGLDLAGRVRALLRSRSDPNVLYLTHANGALRSDDGGQTFVEIALGPADMTISGIDFELLGLRPGPAEEVFAAAIQFPMAHLVRTQDRGVSWQRVQVFADIPDSLVFSGGGEAGLLSFPFDGLYRTVDGGANWSTTDTPADTPWISCLTRIPGTDTLWACGRRGGAWLLGTSVDFGQNWTPRFRSDFREIIGSWACDAMSETARICATACDRSVRDCSEANEEPDGSPGRPVDAGMDQGVDGDDAHINAGFSRRRSDPSCNSAGGSTPVLFGLLLWGRSRRGRKNLI